MFETIKTPSTDITYALAYSDRSSDMEPLILHDLVRLSAEGYPYRAHSNAEVKTWSTWQEALSYAEHFPRENFQLVSVTTSFVTIPGAKL
jgi:hypothetical protein